VILAGLELARRLEAAEVFTGMACAEAQPGAAMLEVAGGVAIFAGAGSPLTRAVGLGMRGAVSAADCDRMEEFFAAHGCPSSVEICPLADPSVVEQLSARGYRLTEFNNVLVRPLAGLPVQPAAADVRLAGPDEGPLWAATAARGFLEKDTFGEEELEVGRTIFRIRRARCYLARAGGQAAAVAALVIHGGLATLFADSTAINFRGRGLQGALIRQRLSVAGEEGCDLATAATLPGSPSQRNYERCGFQVVYTRVVLMR